MTVEPIAGEPQESTIFAKAAKLLSILVEKKKDR